MKQFYSLIIVAALVALIGFEKNVCAQQSDNYYTLCTQWNAYFNANPALKDSDDGDYAQFVRWQEFWKNRVNCADTSLNGKFSALRNAYNQYSQSPAFQLSSINPSPWNYCGPINVNCQWNGQVDAVYVDTVGSSNYQTIYAGTNASGIWKTTDGGQNWTNVTDASGLFFIGVTDIKGDPTNGNIIYATTGGGGYFGGSPWGIGVVRSSDAGATWSPIYSVSPYNQVLSECILVDPTNTNRLFAGVGDMVIRLQFKGTTWNADTLYKYPSNDTVRIIRDIKMKPGSPDTLYVATDNRGWQNYRRAQVLRITGATTTHNYSAQFLHPFCNDSLYSERYKIVVSPLSPKSIYVLGQYYPNDDSSSSIHYACIWKSVDNGVTWKLKYIEDQTSYNTILGGGQVTYYKMEFQISPTDTNVLYVGGNTMSRVLQHITEDLTVDQTTGYESSGCPTYHPDTRASEIVKGSSMGSNGIHDTLFCGNDGGVSMTYDGIRHWTNINGNGLWITEFVGIGSTEQNPYWIGGGSVDNAFFTNASSQWTRTAEGDMGSTIVDFGSPNIVYSNSWSESSSGFYTDQSIDYGSTFPNNFQPTPNEISQGNTPIVLNPKNPVIMFAGAYDLFKTENARSSNPSFAKIPVHINNAYNAIDSAETIKCIVIAESDTNTILFSYGGPHWNKVKDEHKLLKSIDGGANFIDLLDTILFPGNKDLFKAVEWAGITSLAISPLDTSKMWVTLGGVSWSNGVKRVYYSSNGGKSFSDISAGLPVFPVNCIKYWKGGADRIFVGTDVGVFYKDSTLSAWQPYNSGLPVSMVSNLEILGNVDILRIGTYGRGVWETFLHPCNTDLNDTRDITSDETWDTLINMDRSIRVIAPATLTIKTTVRFPDMTKIMVEPGATLVCDSGCDLTNSCNNMWLGIEVWGDVTKPQMPAYQGVVFLKNGALLENARIGITTCQKDNNGNINWSTTGGIIHAFNSTFKNNFKAIEFLSYPNMQCSKFRNVTFETQGIFSDGVSLPQTFVSLFGIKDLWFQGCKFINYNSNTDTTEIVAAPVTSGNGIESIDADYSVVEECIDTVYPCTKWTPSSFTGLYYAIEAQNTVPENPIIINKCQFSYNRRFVYLSGVNFAQVTSSLFRLPPYFPENFGSDTVYGLYLNACTGYKVQENNFVKQYIGTWDISRYPAFIGIDVNNSGIDPNEIYNNSFHQIGIGILAQRINRSSDGTTGLCLKCNEFDTTIYDQAITYTNPPYLTWGICEYQGSPSYDTSLANNTFSFNHYLFPSKYPVNDIYDMGGWIDYYYPTKYPYYHRADPLYRTSNVYPQAENFTYNKDVSCPSKLNNGQPNPGQMKSELLKETNQVSTLNAQLTSLVDGGNTDSTNSVIYFSIPPDSLQLKTNLLNVSPYLSDTVMESAIVKESVLPNNMISDILVANPQSAKSDNVMGELNTRSIPMPDSLMNDILSGQDTTGAKENLESQLSEDQQKESYLFYDLVRFYKQDTIDSWAQDSLITLLQNTNTLFATYMLAFEYLTMGEYNNVTQVLNNIPTQFTLSPDEQQQYQNYLSYIQVLLNLKSKNLTIYDINGDQKNQLNEIATQGSEPVQTYARNVLLANHLISYQEPIDLPDETKSAPVKKLTKPSKILKSGSFKLYPNPAKQYVIVEYNLSDNVNSAENMFLTIWASEGKPIHQQQIIKSHDQVLIDCHNLSSGSYICRIICGKKILGSGKFVIVK
jgi:hypothetical protein